MENRYKFINEKGEHRHELDGNPLCGTSTVSGIITKPLSWWASGMAVKHLGWTHPRPKIAGMFVPVELTKRVSHVQRYYKNIKEMGAEEYLKELDNAYKAHSKTLGTSAKAGTKMHEDLETYVQKCIDENEGKPYPTVQIESEVEKFATWAFTNVEKFIFTEHHCYSERLWLGGIIDCGAVMKSGKTAIVDFKSSKDAYFNQFIQTSLYDIQVKENGLFTADGEQTIEKFEAEQYIVIPFGAPKFHVVIRNNIEDIMRNAESALDLYKGQQTFDKA